MKNYEKLKTIIQEAVPSIMEMKFGCEVSPKKDNQYYDSKEYKNIQYTSNYWFSSGDGSESYNLDAHEILHNFEILGRPITLSDTFIVFLEKIKLKPRSIGFGTIAYNEMVAKLVKLWNLKDNNLDNQSDECKEFLIKLLVK